MTENLPISREESATSLAQMKTLEQVRRENGRALPANAYIRTGLGELPLSSRLRDAVRMLNDVLLPLVDNFEELSPQPLLCAVCGRNFGGWPMRILEDHYFQHTWVQRKLAGIGIR